MHYQKLNLLIYETFKFNGAIKIIEDIADVKYMNEIMAENEEDGLQKALNVVMKLEMLININKKHNLN